MTMSHWCLAIAKAHACMALRSKHMQMLNRPKMSAYEGLAAHKVWIGLFGPLHQHQPNQGRLQCRAEMAWWSQPLAQMHSVRNRNIVRHLSFLPEFRLNLAVMNIIHDARTAPAGQKDAKVTGGVFLPGPHLGSGPHQGQI